LHVLLTATCLDDLEVFLAPTDYQPTSTRSLQPDLLVVRRDDLGNTAVTTPPALAVEVLSPSSRSVDRVLKREPYQQAGVAAYWVVDPEEPTLQLVAAARRDVRRAGVRPRGRRPLDARSRS